MTGSYVNTTGRGQIDPRFAPKVSQGIYAGQPASLALAEQNKKRLAQEQHDNTMRDASKQAALNALTAQRYALDQSYMMQGNSNNPRTVNDTSMEISNAGSMGGENAAGALRRIGASSGASGGSSVPLMQPLVNLQAPTYPSASVPPPAAPVSMNPASYGPADATAYEEAAFGRAKGQAGALGRSALESLRSELSGRGVLGSGAEIQGTADILASATNPLSDLNVAQLGERYAASGRERQLSEGRSQADYSGRISQRGQDINYNEAIAALQNQFATEKYRAELAERNRQAAIQNGLY